MMMSSPTTVEKKEYIKIEDLNEGRIDNKVWIRGRVHVLRAKGKICFLVIRDGCFSIQTIAMEEENDTIRGKISRITKESIVDIYGKIQKPDKEIKSVTHKTIEIGIEDIIVISQANTIPVQIEDLSLPLIEEDGLGCTFRCQVSQNVRLNNRIMDLRTKANQSIFMIQSGVGQLFREYLYQQDFIEIHTPKIISAASEGGAEVFKVQYFDKEAYLAQSPQLYKQMAICSDFKKVFEIGPVFRAEESYTHRHLTEFVCLDLEMNFNKDYHEVLDLIGELFIYMFKNLKSRFSAQLERINQQYPFTPFTFREKTLILEWETGIELLRSNGVEIGDFDDLDTTQEKHLGRLVKDKYETDFFILDKFPLSLRPFYTMPNQNELYSNSFDIFMRGEEICSGSQRIHEPELLEKRAIMKGIDPVTIQSYLDAFKYGCAPHAGAGVGLERVTMLYLGLDNIRKTSLFPRDPTRITP